jgi:Big-like domain-containing protein/WD40 repeat protein
MRLTTITRKPAHPLRLGRLIALSLVTLGTSLAACGDQDPTGTEMTNPADEAPRIGGPALAISDGAHGGNPHFFFLPPLVPNPNPTGTFDPAVTPTVVICALSGSACGATIATYTTTTGPNGEVVKLQAADQLYQVNWKTDQFALSDAINYRIQVSVGKVMLGFADMDIAKHASQIKNLNTGEVIGLVDGSTLPIKFRIETGIVGVVTVSPSTADIEVGETQQFQATVLDLHGNPSAEPVTWSTSSTAIATVDGTGLSTGVSAGTATIQASAQGLVGKAALEVFPASQIAWLKGEDIYIMSGFGKNPTPLTSTGHVHHPAWSHDGTKLAFDLSGQISDPAANNIWTMNANGSGKTMITTGTDADGFPVWSPTGSAVGFYRSLFAGGDRVMTVTADGVTLVEIDPENAGPWLDWSPAGTKLVYSRAPTGKQPSEELDIYVANADGTGQIDLSTDVTSKDVEPRWSPNGSKIVFSRGSASLPTSDIYVMNPDGTQKTNLTSALDGINKGPKWSPDGSKILFLNKRDLYVMDANGTNVARLTNTPNTQVVEPDWSPDGRRIVFHQIDLSDGTGDIYAVKVDGTKTWQLTDSPDFDHEPVWRP